VVEGFLLAFWGLLTRQKIAIETFRITALEMEVCSGRCTLTLKPLALVVEGFLLAFWGLLIRQKNAIETFRITALEMEVCSGRCTLTLKPSALVVEGFLLGVLARLADRTDRSFPAQFPR
jgi:hypothetical protein